MRDAGINAGRRFALVGSLLLALWPLQGQAQTPEDATAPRPPADVPTGALAPSLNLTPPGGGAVAPKGPLLQSLPPAANPTPANPPAAPPVAEKPGQVTLSLAARFGRDMPSITGGLQWRIFPSKPDQTGAFRAIKEDKTASPTFSLPPGSYVVSAAFGLASSTRAVQLRAEPVREVFEIPAGGLRIEGKVGDVRIPVGQISFDIYKGSQFEPGDKRPLVHAVATGDMVLLPEGNYYIVSNYGDGNAVVRSDIRVQAGKLTDATVTHRAAIITLKLVNEHGGEALANTQWSVLTPGGDVIKESIGAFPRVILAEGDYRAIARNEDKTYEREFKVITGVDGEVEVLSRR